KTWSVFREAVFAADPKRFDRFYDEVGRLNEHLHQIGTGYFPRYRFTKKRVCWKFEHITGQNLHIDNIQGCEHQAQARVFVNLATTPRKWSIAEHISAYARRYYEKAGLSRYRDAPFDFNYALSETAFGNSQQQVSDPRHYVE